MTSNQKRRELVLDYFGTFVPGQGTHAEACLQALVDYHQWLETEGYFDGFQGDTNDE